ncbi:MAG: TonB-dependent receptor, partial [Candidatus Margulisiibacteriota bacterium]
RDDIKKYQDLTVPDILSTQPGLEVKRYGSKSGVGSIMIQGAASAETLTLLNGIPFREPIFGAVDFSNIDPDNIESIEIYRGGMSAIYGADAVGGVINIITKKPDNKTRVKLNYGSNNDRGVTLEHSLNGEHFSHRLNYTTAKYDGFRPFSYLDNNNFSGELSAYPNDDFTVKLNFSSYYSQRGNPGQIGSSPSEQQDKGYTLQESADLDLGLAGRSKLYLSQTGYDFFGWGSTSWGPWTYQYQSWTNIAGYQHAFTVAGNSIVVGMDRSAARPNSTDVSPNKTVESRSIYINDEFDLGSKLKMNIGVRRDDHSEFGNANTYKLSSALELYPDIWVKTSYGTSYRAPNINDLYSTWGGNPGLKPEEAHSFDLELSASNTNSKTRLSFFQKNIRNLLQWKLQFSSPSSWAAANVFQAKLSGLEFEHSGRCNSGINYNFNLTYLTDALDESTSSWLMYRPKYKVCLSGDWTNSWGKLAGRINYTAQRPSEYAGIDLRPYWTLDLSYAYGSFTMYANNVLNYEYEESYKYPMPGATLGIKYVVEM